MSGSGRAGDWKALTPNPGHAITLREGAMNKVRSIAAAAAKPDFLPAGPGERMPPASEQTPWPRPASTVETGCGQQPASNPVMRAIRSSLPRIAASDAPVLIQGESGVGKEVIAREIHQLSARTGKCFLKLNCAAVPTELLESELFGYERGAFTGAYRAKPGLFEVAHGGTLMLDEMGDIDFSLQAKLLHVLQDGEFRRLGGSEVTRPDTRVFAATHCDLEQAVREKRFRRDLYYRLNVIQITVPPLRERKDEIPGLVECFLKKHMVGESEPFRVGAELMQLFLEYDWPGNIRELENAVHRLSVLQDPDTLIRELSVSSMRSQLYCNCTDANGLPAAAQQRGDPQFSSAFEQAEWVKLAQEGQAIRAALHATYWNRKRAARLLGVNYKALLYKMKKLGIFEAPEQ